MTLDLECYLISLRSVHRNEKIGNRVEKNLKLLIFFATRGQMEGRTEAEKTEREKEPASHRG